MQSLLLRIGRLSYAWRMLPLFRIIPVGGVLLAIIIVVLAHEPPGVSYTARSPAEMPARGALLRMSDHPEWRQNLILAAVRRADELGRLRELPDSSVRDTGQVADQDTGQAADKIAGLPTGRGESDPEIETGAIKEASKLTLPLDIGETSSTELTVTTPAEKPPLLKTPERKAPSVNRKKTQQRTRHAKTPAKKQPAAAPDLFETIFGGQRAAQPAAPNSAASTIRAEQY